MHSLTGSCLCGRIKVRFPDRFEYLVNCHCSECRKFSGAAFSSVGGVASDTFEIVSGSESIAVYHKTEDTDLHFCSACGSSLFSRKLARGLVNVRLGILDNAPSRAPEYHIYVGSKAPWHEITDALPCHAERPPRRIDSTSKPAS
jgi:hypothetical protein